MIASLAAQFRNMPRRVGRAAHLADIALGIGESPMRVLNQRWRAAIDVVRFNLLPNRVRANLRTLCDVGANRGDWTAGILELATPELVVAFEPIPAVFAALNARFASRPNVRCVQAAVGSSLGEVTLNIEAMTELSSVRPLGNQGRLVHGVVQPHQEVSVPLVTLDSQMSDVDELSLIKLDVQGYEDQVIGGARQVLERCQCLVTEVLYERDYYVDALPFLELARLIEATSPLRLSCVSEPALAPDGSGMWADAVFVRPLRR
jgi:FkbM family methyltransferase